MRGQRSAHLVRDDGQEIGTGDDAGDPEKTRYSQPDVAANVLFFQGPVDNSMPGAGGCNRKMNLVLKLV